MGQIVSRVLIVDDEEVMCRAMVRLLRADHEVVTVGDGVAALDLIRDGQRFDMILCDVGMPRMGGVEFLERLACEAPDQLHHMAFFSADTYSAPATTIAGRAFTVIEKPFDPRLVRALVNKMVRPPGSSGN